MRIIKRKSLFNKPDLFVVQEEGWNSAFGNQNSLMQGMKVSGKTFQDIRAFLSLEEAKTFMHQYVNNLQPGEEIVG